MATHTNNWAVLVCSSRYWFNYRHMANTLSIYRTVKRLGIPDDHIILMLADDVACNPRNAFPGKVFANKGRELDLYGGEGEGVEVDYRGYEVTVESFLRVLTGRLPAHMPPSKHLLSDASSNILLYLTGHGGDGFLKFQDNEEIGSRDLGDAIGQMYEKRRYGRMLVMVDTCQANTLYQDIWSPGVLATGSSKLGENSYAHHSDMDIGVAVIDSFTHYALQYLKGIEPGSNATMQEFFNTYDPAQIKSHPGIRTDLFPDSLTETLVTDFFGSVPQVEMPSHRPFPRNDSSPWTITVPPPSARPVISGCASGFNASADGIVVKPAHDLHTVAATQQDWLVVGALVAGLWALKRWTGARRKDRLGGRGEGFKAD